MATGPESQRNDECDKCGLPYKEELPTPGTYEKYSAQLNKFVAEGRLHRLTFDPDAGDSLAAFQNGDIMVHCFRCAECEKAFRLQADTFHGGASFELVRGRA